MDGYGPSEDDCWSALMKGARMRNNGLVFYSPFIAHVVWSVPMRFDTRRAPNENLNE